MGKKTVFLNCDTVYFYIENSIAWHIRLFPLLI